MSFPIISTSLKLKLNICLYALAVSLLACSHSKLQIWRVPKWNGIKCVDSFPVHQIGMKEGGLSECYTTHVKILSARASHLHKQISWLRRWPHRSMLSFFLLFSEGTAANFNTRLHARRGGTGRVTNQYWSENSPFSEKIRLGLWD